MGFIRLKLQGEELCLSFLSSRGESISCLFQDVKGYIPRLMTPLAIFKARALQLPILLTCLPPSFSYNDYKDAFVTIRTPR